MKKEANSGRGRIFMIGVGGMGMAPLAIYLRQMGQDVLGFDDNLQAPVGELLKDAGVEMQTSTQFPEHIDKVVYSSAIREGHPQLKEAAKLGLPTLRRGEMKAEVLEGKKIIAIVGSHGKTTSVGMLTCSLLRNGFSFGYLLGGLFNGRKLSPAHYSESEWVVAEIDESDGTIDLFQPEITVALNLDWDHTDFYAGLEDLEKTIKRLFQRTRGVIFLPAESDSLIRLAEDSLAEKIQFGCGGCYHFKSVEIGRDSLSVSLSGYFPPQSEVIPAAGLFNAENALPALALSHYLTGALCVGSLCDFPGIRRRQKLLHETGELSVYEDYAHHPSEIQAMVHFARETYSDRRLLVVFQPHRYSRTLRLKGELGQSLRGAHELFLLDVYAASETPLEGGSSDDLADCFPDDLRFRRVNSYSRLSALLFEAIQEPAVLLFLGAGDIDQWAATFVRELQNVKPFNGHKSAVDLAGMQNHSWWEKLHSEVDEETALSTSESLADKTTLRVGGAAFFFAEPASVEDLSLLLKGAAARSLPVYFLGRGSNLIVPDDGVAGLVIRLNHESWRSIKPLGEGRLWVGGGARLKQICGEACRLGLAGLEFLEGIPGSLGGSLRMNAGAMGGWIFDVVEEVQFMTIEGVLKTLPKEKFQVGYRECRELHQAIAVGAILKANDDGSSGAIRAMLDEYSNKRKSSQPKEPSVGCIFKNPKDRYAGKIIDELGLKGLRVGEAEVSSIHGNFIVNRGGATYGDVVTLIRNIRQEVRKRTGIELQPEVLLMGKSWDQVL